jgi:asparagine synthase (glutamine-hydrolysing)
MHMSQMARRFYWKRLGTPPGVDDYTRRVIGATGGFSAFHDFYGMMGINSFRFFSPAMWEKLGDHVPYADLGANLDRVRRWHPINQGLYWGARIHLAGLLLHLKGDRVSMHSSVETRYPFLDERVFGFLAKLDPRWKLRGLKDKYLLRLLGERWLPKSTAWTPKGMFRAPLDSFFGKHPPAYINDLLSRESLQKAGYFDPDSVDHWRQMVGGDWWRGDRSASFREYKPNSHKRVSVELGLVAVLATQLWHHMYIDNGLADLPTDYSRAAGQAAAEPVSARP